MKISVPPGKIKGTIQAPASKSVCQRALAAALIRKGTSVLYGLGDSEDEKSMMRIVSDLGATLTKLDDGSLKVISDFPDRGIKHNQLNCGESGLALRMMTPIAALSSQEITIFGQGSLQARPLLFSETLLNQLNIFYSTEKNQLPIKIKGILRPDNIELDGSVSSQFLTGLLFAFSAAGAANKSIFVHQLVSKPYIDLTLSVLEDFGMAVPENRNYEQFFFPQKKEQRNQKQFFEYTVEGDWSNAAFLLVAGAIAGNISVKGLNVFSKQADKKILEALIECGCGLSIQPTEISVQSTVLNPFYFDATQCPDLFPPLVALAANCQGRTVIKGVSRLAYKESNRALSLQSEFGKLGLLIRMEDDQLIIEGGKLTGGTIHSHNDHRIAMACAVAALNAVAPVEIEHAAAVNKSYPRFFDDLKMLSNY